MAEPPYDYEQEREDGLDVEPEERPWTWRDEALILLVAAVLAVMLFIIIMA